MIPVNITKKNKYFVDAQNNVYKCNTKEYFKDRPKPLGSVTEDGAARLRQFDASEIEKYKRTEGQDTPIQEAPKQENIQIGSSVYDWCVKTEKDFFKFMTPKMRKKLELSGIDPVKDQIDEKTFNLLQI